MHTRVGELLGAASARLAAGSDTARLDAEVLLAHVLGRDRSWLYAWPEYGLDEGELVAFAGLVDARSQGLPIAHLVGQREFWSLPLRVDRHTLIPRPETERLVEIALSLGLKRTAQALDLGTGSGAIAIALASQRPDWQIIATDRSASALDVARDNARRLGYDNIRFAPGDWYAALRTPARFDLIVSNPPYIAEGDPHLDRGDVRFEPREALVSGDAGLSDLRRIIDAAPHWLVDGGHLWLEHGWDQAEAVTAVLRERGFVDVETRRDDAGHARHSGGRIGQSP